MVRQGEVLGKLIRKEAGDGSLSVWDCTCGIGTQSIGLALQGHSVVGTDISREAVNRATREALSFGVLASFGVANLLDRALRVDGPFDVVLSCDNSLPHLLSDHDLVLAASNIRSNLKSNGTFLASIRDYDEILETRPNSTMPRVFDDGRRIVFQVWDWLNDGSRNYVFHLFIMTRAPDGSWAVSVHAAQYRAMRRLELARVLMDAGFSGTRWLMPEETGYYQPIVIARN